MLLTCEALVIHPGSAMTNLEQHGTGLTARIVTPIAERLLMGSADGARLPKGADDPDEGKRLWDTSEQLTGVAFDLGAGAAV